MFDNLTARLSRTVDNLRGRGRITDDNVAETLREVRMALLEADGGLYWFDAGEACSYTAHLMGLDLLTLRALFISHPHADHIGGMDDVIRARHDIKLPREVMEMGDPRWIK